MKKILLLFAWLPAATLSLILSILLLSSYSYVKEGNSMLVKQAKELLPKNQYQFFAALPEVLGSFTSAISKQDARPVILEEFLRSHKSPIMPHAQFIVDQSDAYGIDFRLITAIAMCESTAGKFMPEGSHNAWGYAIYTGESSGAEFRNWQEAIGVMAKYLSDRYYQRGLTTPEEIGPIYAPPSVETGNSWAKCVRTFMDELK